MKLIKQLMIGAAFFASVTSAHAATINLGSLPAGYSTFSNILTPGTFADTINFSLSRTSDTDYGAGPLNFSIGKVEYLNISNLALSLLDSSNNVLGSGLSFSVASLAAGNYHLQVTGNADGVTGGLYAGGVNVTPVPEADTFAMMLAGLSLMGFVARRRRAR